MRKIIAVIVLTLMSTHARADGSDADAMRAARLLFGEGLKIESDEGARRVKIAFDPQSGLDDARVRKLIATYIGPRVDSAAEGYTFNAEYQVLLTDHGKARDK